MTALITDTENMQNMAKHVRTMQGNMAASYNQYLISDMIAIFV